MQTDYLTNLLGIKGYRVSAVEQTWDSLGRSIARVLLERIGGDYICGRCGRTVSTGYDHSTQELRHLMFWQHDTSIRFERYRVDCPGCGVQTEALEFVGVRGPRVTRPLASLIHELCKITTVKAVAVLFGLHRHTVKDIDKVALEDVQAKRPLDGITVLGMDEIAVGKGHNYWTLVSSLEGPRGPEMLNVVEGRSEKRLKRFWRWFGKDRATQITHVVIDMCRAFEKSVRAHCRKKVGDVVIMAKIIYDKFHVVRHLNDALNTVRKDELGKALGRFKKTLSGKKFVLLARRSRVRGHAREALDTILAASPKLQKAYLLKESFPHLWDYTYKGCALRFWQHWKAQLKWSRLKSYRRFVKLVDRHWDGILAFCDKKVSLGYIESSNLKARNVIRRAYGYRDEDYMKLKIIQACTPWMAQFRPWTVAHSSVP
jgi:transposase